MKYRLFRIHVRKEQLFKFSDYIPEKQSQHTVGYYSKSIEDDKNYEKHLSWSDNFVSTTEENNKKTVGQNTYFILANSFFIDTHHFN